MEKMRIIFPEDGAEALARLNEEDAPVTCEAIRRALPIRGRAIHDIWSGQIVFTFLEPTKVLPFEGVSRTGAILPGDVFYWYAPENYLHGRPYGRNGYSEIAIAYGRDCFPMSTRGPKRVNVFATIIEGLEDVAEVCDSMVFEGERRLVIEGAD